MRVDYVILGAGLSGMVLRRALDRSKTAVIIDPRPGAWKIGEANSPEMFASDLLGSVLEKARDLPSFSQKNGSVFIGADSVAAYPIVSNRHEAMHVARDELENLLLEEWQLPIVREHVVDVDVEGRAVRTEKGVYEAREQIIDCSGAAMLVATALGETSALWPIASTWRYLDVAALRPSAHWAHLAATRRETLFVDIPNIRLFPDSTRDAWMPQEATSLTQVRDGVWLWQIPLFGSSMVSVGFVSSDLTLGEKDLDAFIAEHLMKCYDARPRSGGHPVYDRVHTRTGFARRARQAATMGHILVGDAFMFVDPVYSVGTTIAVNKALEVATLLNAGGWTERRCANFNARYAKVLQKRTEAFGYWYSQQTREGDANTARVQRYFPQMTAFQAGITWQYAQVVSATLRLTGMVTRGVEGRPAQPLSPP